MNPNKALWEKGDFTRIASSMRTGGEALVGQLGADVLGVDIASNLVAAGNRRAQEAGLANLRFEEGDACELSGQGDPTLVAQNLKTCSAYTPPPPEGFISPMTWGMEDNALERWTAAGIPAERVASERQTFVFTAPVPPSEYLTWFRDYYGPTMNACAAAEASGRTADLHRELDTLFNAQNQSGDKTTTRIPATYLKVTVRR